MNALISAVFPVVAQQSRAVQFAFFAVMMAVQFVVVQRSFPETMNVSLEQLQHQLGVEAKSRESAYSRAIRER